MDLGYIVKNALNRAELPVDDEAHLELARNYANDNIDELWYSCRADWNTSSSSISTISGIDEYIVNKYFDALVPATLRGVSTYRRIIHFVEQERFFRITQANPFSQGNPIIATHGDYYGIDAQLNSSSAITVQSSFASKTVGTVKTIAQSKTITGTNTLFNLNDIGARLRISGDTKSYKILQVVGQTLTLEEPYEGASQDTAAYESGDIDLHVNVKGYVAGAVDSEDIVLNGATAVTGQKIFTTLLSVSKSDMTLGKVTAKTALNQIVATLDPSELEIERRSLKLWRIPSAVETLNYRFYMRHPRLRMDSDRPLLPEKYHRLLVYMTEADLRQWADRSVPDILSSKIAIGREKYINDAQNTAQGSVNPNPEGINSGYNEFWNPFIDQDFTMGELW